MRQPAGSERDALEQIARAGRERADRVARAKILLAIADGARFTEAARIAGRRSGDAVARLVARWNAEGLASLEARYHGGRRGATGGVAARAVAEASEPAPTAIAAVTLPPASSVIPDAGGGGGDFITETLTNGHPSRGRLFVRGADIRRMLELALEIDGVLAVALVDLASGMILGAVERAGGSGLDLDVAAAGNTEVVRAKLATIRDLGMNGGIEDILITLSTQYHLIRPLGSDPGVFLYTVINREESRLALAQRGLSQIEAGSVV
jgi:hypothetical protein